jgi:glycosyltransferase involved in cell wall biosynthesis
MTDGTLSDEQLAAYDQADVIFVAQDGFTLAPSRVRAYSFAKACRDRGLSAEVLSFYDHLNSGNQGSDAIDRLSDDDKLRLTLRAFDILSRNPRAVLYMQKVTYASLSVCMAASRNGNRMVLDYDDFDLTTGVFPPLSRYVQGLQPIPLTESIARSADMCICASQLLYDFMAERNPNTHLLPTGTDLSIFDVSLRDKVERPKDDLVEIIWLGDIWGQPVMEDVLFAVDAFCHLPESVRALARFTIVGFGRAWPWFKDEVAQRYPFIGAGPGCVHFQERMAPGDVPALLARCDIGCIPLSDQLFNRCKSPTKMFEFMAMKVALCSTPTGEAGRILHDGENAMVAGDRAGYFYRLGKLIVDADLRRSVAEQAHADVVAGLHIGAIGDRLVPLLGSLLLDRS